MRIWECDMCKKRLQDGEVVPLMEFDLCPVCIDRVKKFIKEGLEPTICLEPSDFRANQLRKTCNTCVHLLSRKSRCLKKNIQIHENDRDACDDWDNLKRCTNCRDAGFADGEGVCTSMKAIFQGERGYCGGWHS